MARERSSESIGAIYNGGPILPSRGEKVKLTDRINRIQVSPTSAVITAADQLKAKGVDIADFGPGEPDFPTPDHIKRARRAGARPG